MKIGADSLPAGLPANRNFPWRSPPKNSGDVGIQLLTEIVQGLIAEVLIYEKKLYAL